MSPKCIDMNMSILWWWYANDMAVMSQWSGTMSQTKSKFHLDSSMPSMPRWKLAGQCWPLLWPSSCRARDVAVHKKRCVVFIFGMRPDLIDLDWEKIQLVKQSKNGCTLLPFHHHGSEVKTLPKDWAACVGGNGGTLSDQSALDLVAARSHRITTLDDTPFK